MKPNFETFPRFQLFARIVAATLALSTPDLFAGDLNVTYTTGAEVPVTSNGFTAMGKNLNITLNFAPAPGTQLMVVQNTGPGIIRGTFTNLATAYFLLVGSSPHGADIYNSGVVTVHSTTVNNVPTDGRTIYVTLGSQVNRSWTANDYTYTAFH